MGNEALINELQPKLSRFLDNEHPRAGFWAMDLISAAIRFEAATKERFPMLIAEIGHESGWFTDLDENLNYSAERLMVVFKKYFPTPELAAQYAHQPKKIANRVYANRMGNGDETSGDGWKYRGRGPLQWTGEDNLKYRVTGREHYQVQGTLQGKPILDNPDLLLESGPGCFWATWWWANHGLNQVADTGDIEKCTRVINGGTIGLDQRIAIWERAKVALGV